MEREVQAAREIEEEPTVEGASKPAGAREESDQMKCDGVPKRVRGKSWRPQREAVRDAHGLTAAMRQALPIMATCKSPREGMKVLGERRIIQKHTYYTRWSRDPHWIRALNREREKFLGSVRRRAQSVAIHEVEAAVEAVVGIAKGEIDAKPGQLAACIEVCRLAGVDRAVDQETTVNVFALMRERITQQLNASSGERITQMAFGVPVEAAESEIEPVDIEDISIEESEAGEALPDEDELEEADAAEAGG
jgi:hypothetical protein